MQCIFFNGFLLNTDRSDRRSYTGDDMILDYLKPTNYLSVEEERELLKLCKQNNDSAKEKLVLSNIRFIYSEAKKLNSQKVSIDDLVVAGIQGLLEAIPKFDMSSNNRFMTFASFWIRKELFDYIYQNSSQLKVSTPKVTLAIKLRKKYAELSSMKDNSNVLFETANACNCSVEEAKELLNATSPCTSLNATYSEEDSVSLLNFMESDCLSPEELYIEKEAKLELIKAINKLTPAEKDVIIRHNGLFNHPSQTFEEIAKIQKKTKARIHQIEKTAKEKLYRTLAA